MGVFIIQSCKITRLFNLNKTSSKPFLSQFTYPWEALDALSKFIIELGNTLSFDEYDYLDENIWISKKATVAPSASITGPCIIEENCEIRHNAFIRGSVLIGAYSVVGNSTELKNSILFEHVQVPHFNYIGDSILGYRSHLGAGAITSNIKSDKTPVMIKHKTETMDTKRKKVGAMVGDYSEVGCNSVLCPGSILGQNVTIYPTSCIRHVIEENHIVKNNGDIVSKNKGANT